MDAEKLNGIVSQIATRISDSTAFRSAAVEAAAELGPTTIEILAQRFHTPPDAPSGFGPEEVGLGGWLSYWQFAIFEIYYNFGADAIPMLRSVAYGEYDWTQGNAIEILCRLAADGINTPEIVDELKREFPKLRHEAQLYAVRPMLAQADDNPQLAAILNELSTIEQYQETVEELTYVNPDPENVTYADLHGTVVSIERINERKWHANVIGIVAVSGLNYFSFDQCNGNARLGVTDTTRLLRLADGELQAITLDEVSVNDRVALGHYGSTELTDPVTVYPKSITVL